MNNPFSLLKHPIVESVSFVVFFLCLQLVASSAVLLVCNALSVAPASGTAVGAMQSPAQMVIALIVFNALALVLFLGMRWSKVSGAYIKSRPWSVLIWSAVASLGTLLPSMWIQEQMPELPAALKELTEQSEASMVALMQTRGGYAVICLLAPLVEEIVFRGAVLRSLLSRSGYRPWVSIAISAVLFALAHLNPAQMPHAFIVGLLLGWMYWRTGSIVPGVVLHWTNNTAAYLIFHAYPDPDIKLNQIFSGSDSSVLAAVFFSLLILLPSLYQLYLRMKPANE